MLETDILVIQPNTKEKLMDITIHCVECDQQIPAEEYAYGHDCEAQ